MGRLRLPPGTAGEIKVKQVGTVFVARCWYRCEDGTYADIRRRGSTREKARAAVRDAIKDFVARTPGASLTASTFFSDAAREWLDQYQTDAENGIYSLGSVDTYRDHLRKHVLPTLGNLRLVEIKAPVINNLCQAKLKSYSLSLAKHTKVVIGNVLTFAVQAGAIERNPTKEIAQLTERRAKTKKKKPRALTGEQVIDFLAKLDADEEALLRDLPDLVRFFVATGERLGEALGAHWSDFDAEAKALTMTGNIIQVRGRGAVRNKGKSETADRTIPLPAWCARMLSERKATLGTVGPDAPIFPNTRGGYLNASNLNNRYWVPFRKRAGYEWVTFHTFRKTVATLLDDAGLSARQIADVLGHAHPSMTLNSYMGRGQASRASADALDTVPGLTK
ncbi:MAG TPA: tyrosine-type recombinase/integrase [Pseudonocardiaceae bacterium]|jgi:integrase|nr:tyrosine-type recombinase/integrase [Pseudonocardiaceae bacterium]